MGELLLPDYIKSGLQILFVGFNPGVRSAEIGHHFAGKGNHFFRLLYEAGLTPWVFRPDEDHLLPSLGIGLTNVVQRATPGSADLTRTELRQGAEHLRAKIAAYRPRVVCLLGKEVYRVYAGLPTSQPTSWGLQPRYTVPATMDFLAPNPSARSTVPYAERLRLFRELSNLVVRYGQKEGLH